MNTEEIIETAIQGHASTRDAIRWAIQQEREACAKMCDEIETEAGKLWKAIYEPHDDGRSDGAFECAKGIRARGNK